MLAGQWLSGMTGSELLDEARHLHPHAKRGLLIAWGGWGDRATGEAIFDAIAHGRIDHYVLRPSAPPDELFHQAISGLLLEWAEARRTSPHTVHVVGESWSGRAYELREVLGRCAMPHTFCLADSERWARPRRRGGRRRRKLPLVVFPDGTVLADPSNAEHREGRGLAGEPGADGLRPRDRRRRTGRAVGGGLRRLGGLQHPGRRRGRHRRPGDLELAHPQLPRLPSRRQRPPAGQQAYEQAWVFGANFAFMQRVTGLEREGDGLVVDALRQRPGAGPRRGSGHRAPATGGSACRRSRR